MIEIAQPEQVDDIFQMLLEMRAETRFAKYPYTEQRAKNTLQFAINQGVILVARGPGNDLQGGLALVLALHPLVDYYQASDLFLYVRPAWRKSGVAMELIETAKAWAIGHGAVLQMGTTTDLEAEATSRLFEHCGLRHLGALHVME